MRTPWTVIALACGLAAGCKKSDKKEPAAALDAAPAPKTQFELKVLSVSTPGRITSGSGYEEESWTANEGYKFVVVEADVTLNTCEEDAEMDRQLGDPGDGGVPAKQLWARVHSQDGWLITADARRIESVGGGGGPADGSARTCVGCETMVTSQCGDGPPETMTFRFVFGVEAAVDPATLTLEYRDARAPLAVAAK